MNGFVDAILVFIVLANMFLLGSGRLGVYIRIVAVQSIILSLLFMDSNDFLHFHSLIIPFVTIIIKGVIFPTILFRAVRETGVKKEIEPFVSYNFSLFIGIAVWIFSLWLGKRLPMPLAADSDLIFPVTIFTAFVGLFLIVSRRNAITQVLGYLVLENGIYIFGSAIQSQQPFLVELGILLDIFVAVFVMVITLFQINREIGDIKMDTSKLAALKD
ncbi:MAG: hydrogenase [Candidatus Riflebacteria bacterium]|nr:hydrogenase [Candidatus Riflebacteria bacterium]